MFAAVNTVLVNPRIQALIPNPDPQTLFAVVNTVLALLMFVTKKYKSALTKAVYIYSQKSFICIF